MESKALDPPCPPPLYSVNEKGESVWGRPTTPAAGGGASSCRCVHLRRGQGVDVTEPLIHGQWQRGQQRCLTVAVVKLTCSYGQTAQAPRAASRDVPGQPSCHGSRLASCVRGSYPLRVQQCQLLRSGGGHLRDGHPAQGAAAHTPTVRRLSAFFEGDRPGRKAGACVPAFEAGRRRR